MNTSSCVWVCALALHTNAAHMCVRLLVLSCDRDRTAHPAYERAYIFITYYVNVCLSSRSHYVCAAAAACFLWVRNICACASFVYARELTVLFVTGKVYYIGELEV